MFMPVPDNDFLEAPKHVAHSGQQKILSANILVVVFECPSLCPITSSTHNWKDYNYKLRPFHCKISGFFRGVSKTLAIVGCYAAYIGKYDVSGQPIGPIFKGEAVQEECRKYISTHLYREWGGQCFVLRERDASQYPPFMEIESFCKTCHSSPFCLM
jgi:hypothetical protein